MEPFKNLLGLDAARTIARALHRAHPGFQRSRFLRGLERELEPLELKARMMALEARLARELEQLLLAKYAPRTAFPILEAALKQNDADDYGLEGFLVWPLTHHVARTGLSDFEASMHALSRMTQVFTAEFAIRPFLKVHESCTLRRLEEWTEHPNKHLRRLASEGSRPLLPWGEKLPEFVRRPDKTWPILERLKDDPEVYVQKSVANHINDHSKAHADWVLLRLKEWSRAHEGGEIPQSRLWVIRHATRTLIKKGHPQALALQGVRTGAITLMACRILTPRVRLGDALEVELRVKNAGKKSERVVVDHEVWFLKSRGQHSPKVFKGREFMLEAGGSETLRLRIPLKPVTTRTYFSGKQGYRAKVNGVEGALKAFELKT